MNLEAIKKLAVWKSFRKDFEKAIKKIDDALKNGKPVSL